MKKPQLYSIPMIFHKSIGHVDTPDYIRVCAHNRDSKEAVLEYIQKQPEIMLYGQVTSIEFDSECNVNHYDQTHWKLSISRPERSENASGDKQEGKNFTSAGR
jgi:hypothetical protein